jgi:hypothetical protein
VVTDGPVAEAGASLGQSRARLGTRESAITRCRPASGPRLTQLRRRRNSIFDEINERRVPKIASSKDLRGGRSQTSTITSTKVKFNKSTTREKARTPRRLPRPGGTELRRVPPHCSRDLGHGHGAGSEHLPRLQPPTCSRFVNGVGLGLSLCGVFTLFTAVSRPQLYCLFFALRFSTVVSKRIVSPKNTLFDLPADPPRPPAPQARRSSTPPQLHTWTNGTAALLKKVSLISLNYKYFLNLATA